MKDDDVLDIGSLSGKRIPSPVIVPAEPAPTGHALQSRRRSGNILVGSAQMLSQQGLPLLIGSSIVGAITTVVNFSESLSQALAIPIFLMICGWLLWMVNGTYLLAAGAYYSTRAIARSFARSWFRQVILMMIGVVLVYGLAYLMSVCVLMAGAIGDAYHVIGSRPFAWIVLTLAAGGIGMGLLLVSGITMGLSVQLDKQTRTLESIRQGFDIARRNKLIALTMAVIILSANMWQQLPPFLSEILALFCLQVLASLYFARGHTST